MSTDLDQLREQVDNLDLNEESQGLIDEVINRVETAEQLANDATRIAQRATRQTRELRKRVDELEAQLAETDQRTELLEEITDGHSLTVDDRAATLVQTLANQAQQSAQGTAAMDYQAANAALGGTLHRPQIYAAMERAADLVDHDGVRYISESRSSERNTRLVTDLENCPDDCDFLPTLLAHR